MSTDGILVSLAVTAAALWLIRRAWIRARDRYRSGPCCGEGCGCVKPVLFGPKDKKAPPAPRPADKR